MVSYSRLRPAMSRDDPRRCSFEAAPVRACGAARVLGGSVPVVLMLSPSGRLARVATDKEVLLEGGVSTTTFPLCLSLLLFAVEAVHGRGQAVFHDGLHRVGGPDDQLREDGGF